MCRIALAVGLFAVTASFIGCAATCSGFGAINVKERHELYTRCIDARMKQADFGSGTAVHQVCLKWARNQT